MLAAERMQGVERVLGLSTLLGFVVGAFVRPTWTDNVESAQVVAGFVTYPPDNVMGAYHESVYTVLIQSAAALLRLGCSEWALSVLFSGLQGAVVCAGLALVTLSVSRSRLVALAAPVLLLRMSAVAAEWPELGQSSAEIYAAHFHGHLYPNSFPNSAAIYGSLGLGWVLLSLGFFSVGWVRSGSFLLGLLPALHPGLAPAGLVGLLACVLCFARSLRPWVPDVLRYGSLGLGVFALTAAWKVTAAPPVLPWLADGSAEPFVAAFVEAWDDHNPPLLPGEWRWFFEPEYYTLALSAVLLASARRRLPLPARVALVAVLGIASAGALYTILLGSIAVPWQFHTLLATRWLNLSALTFVALGIGLLGRLAFVERDAGAALVLLATVALVLGGYSFAITAASSLVRDPESLLRAFSFPLLVAFAPVGLHLLRSTPWWLPLSARCLRFLRVLVAVALVGSLLAHQVAEIATARMSGRDEHSEILALAGARPGLLLVGQGDVFWRTGRIQLRTRRPLLLDPTQLNLVLKTPAQGQRLADLLVRIYGVSDLRAGPPASFDRHWSDVDMASWVELRRELGVTDVLVRSDLPLRLPVVAKSEKLALYAIP